MRDLRTLTLAACLGLLIFAPVAAAHGLGTGDPNRPVIDYLWLGTKHLLAGWDHLLFILGVVLVAGSLWRATKLISLFVLGHSITLALGTYNEWTVSATFVDIVIALSVAAVALAGLRWRPPNWRIFGAGLFAFGLIHGLGLATRLQELGVSDDSLMWRVLLFNIGIEIGQAIAVLAFAALGWLLVRVVVRPDKLMRPAFAGIGLAGLIGAMVLTLPGPDGESASGEQVVREVEACRVVQVAASPSGAGGHPERPFYEPGEPYPGVDFEHVMLDGYVVVTYRPDLRAGELDQLRASVGAGEEGLLAGAEQEQKEAVVATTLERELRCTRLDVEALTEFREEWVEEYLG